MSEKKYLLELPRSGWLPPIGNVQVMTHSRCNADCFAAETPVITAAGDRAIAELCEQSPKLLVPGLNNGTYGNHGVWFEAPVRSFGVQPLLHVALRRGSRRKVIRTTAGHRWILRHFTHHADGRCTQRRVARTEALRPGDALVSCHRAPLGVSAHPIRLSRIGIMQGFVFGDGSHPARAAGPATVRLYAKKDLALLDYFSGFQLTTVKVNGGKLVPEIRDLPRYWKRHPPLDESKSFLLGWLAGYFAADGCVPKASYKGVITSARAEDMDFVRAVCCHLGIGVSPVSAKKRGSAAFANAGLDYSVWIDLADVPLSFFIQEHHRARAEAALAKNPTRLREQDWIVEEVLARGESEEVFCATVEDAECFSLADNVLTGNCVFPLRGDTLAHTPLGPVALKALAAHGEPARLLVPDMSPGQEPRNGVFVDARVRSYGLQPVQELRLSRGSKEKVVWATAEHRWLLADWETVAATERLRPGDLLATCSLGGPEARTLTWRVDSIGPLSETLEEVFCATIPAVGCFVLEDDLVSMNCPHAESEHGNNPGVMEASVWRLILDNLVPFQAGINKGKFAPYLMNEPLVDRTIFAKIEDIYRYFPQTCVEVSTNGAALTEKVIDKLLVAMAGKRHDIWVSFHGIDKETHEQIMAIDFEKALVNAVNLLKKADGKFSIKLRGGGQSRDGKHHYFSRQQYLDFWQGQFQKHGINTQGVDLDYFSFHDRAAGLRREDRGANTLNQGVIRQLGPEHEPFWCNRLCEWIHFRWDGQISLCCMDYHHEVKLPNIQDVWLVEYFHSDEYTQLVEKVSGRKKPEDGFICTRCSSPGG